MAKKLKLYKVKPLTSVDDGYDVEIKKDGKDLCDVLATKEYVETLIIHTINEDY